jgi:hypothetical protein
VKHEIRCSVFARSALQVCVLQTSARFSVVTRLRAAPEQKMIVDERREKLAAIEMRKRAYLSALESRGQRVEKPDYSQCTKADEGRIVALGGSLATWRLICSEEPADLDRADRVLAVALESLGCEVPEAVTVQAEAEDEPEPDADALEKLGLRADLARCKTADEARAVWARGNGPERR